MRLRALDFERRAARLVRPIVRASAEHWSRYRWQLLLNRVDMTAKAAVLGLSALGFVWMPLAFSMPVIGFGIIPGANRPGVNPLAVALALESAVFTGFAMGYTMLGHHYRISNRLPLLAYFPRTDSAYSRCGMLCLLEVFYVVAALSLVPTYYGWKAGLMIPDWLALPVVLLLETGLLYSTPLVAALFIRRSSAQQVVAPFAFTALTVGGVLLGGTAHLIGRNLLTSVVTVLYVVVPAAWPAAIWNYAVLDGQSVAWLLLIPIAGFLAIALRPLRTLRRFHELSINSDRQVEPVFAPAPWWKLPGGLLTVEDAPPVDLFPTAARVRENPPDFRLLAVAALAGKYLAPLDWPSRGPVERWIARRLNDRERTIADYWQGGPAYGTHGWCVLCGLAILASAVAVQLPAGVALDMPFIRLTSLALVMIVMVSGSGSRGDGRAASTGARQQVARASLPIFAQYPVGIREVLRLNDKIATRMFFFALPPMIGFGLVSGTHLGGAPAFGAIDAVIPLVAGLIWQTLFTPVLFSTRTNDTDRFVRRLIGWTLAGIVWLSMIGIFLIPLRNWPLLVASGVALLSCSRLARWLCIRGFERWEVDIVR